MNGQKATRIRVLSPDSGGVSAGTRKGTLLESVPLCVTTWTSPVVTPAGTVVVISELDTTVKVAAVPVELTLVVPVRLVPRMLTAAPTFPEAGSRRQTDRQTEQRATVGGAEMVLNLASTNRRPVEGPVGMLDQSRGECAIALVRVEVIRRRQGAG